MSGILKKAIRYRNFILAGFLLAGIGTLINLPVKVSAVTGNQWNAAHIIDDGVFFNSKSMSAHDIQVFLNAKVPTCDTNGTQPSGHAGYATRADWGRANGAPPPYTCVKDYSQAIPGYGPDAYCDHGFSGGNFSAAQIIYTVSYWCDINPQDLIVLLQKEQTLVTDDWPWPVQYRSATGYGCPDTAACDSQYYGFFNQVAMAARQFKRYVRQPNSFNYAANRTSFIAYNPNAGCGGTNVTIQNGATAALYNYTPYQPNAAALNNLYGTGDGCSAYGNRNFWRLFNDWFGSTSGWPYAWSLTQAHVYSDNTKARELGTAFDITAGDRVYVSVKAMNIGNNTWSNTGNNPVHMGVSKPRDANSWFCDNTWITCNRPTSLIESSVPPGQVGTFEFWVKAPDAPGIYREYYNPLSEWNTWMNDIGFYIQPKVWAKSWSWAIADSKVYTDASKATQLPAGFDLNGGQTAFISIKAKNTGNQVWTNTGNNPIRAGVAKPRDANSWFCDASWVNCHRPATLKESSVAPGQTGTFEFLIKAPNAPGTYKEYFNPLSEWNTWMNNPGLYYQITVH